MFYRFKMATIWKFMFRMIAQYHKIWRTTFPKKVFWRNLTTIKSASHYGSRFIGKLSICFIFKLIRKGFYIYYCCLKIYSPCYELSLYRYNTLYETFIGSLYFITSHFETTHVKRKWIYSVHLPCMVKDL